MTSQPPSWAHHETPDVAELRRLAEAASAWDEGADFVTRHPGMSAEYVRAANPYRHPSRADSVAKTDGARFDD